MYSLYTICLKYIIHNDINYHNILLPMDVIKDITSAKLSEECGNVVSQMLDIETKSSNIKEAVYMGCYYYINLRYFERKAKEGEYNCGFISCPLSVYYLKDELFFSQIFKTKHWFMDAHRNEILIKSIRNILH